MPRVCSQLGYLREVTHSSEPQLPLVLEGTSLCEPLMPGAIVIHVFYLVLGTDICRQIASRCLLLPLPVLGLITFRVKVNML